jgi:hypothetical protein
VKKKYTELKWGLKLLINTKVLSFTLPFFFPDCLELVIAIAMCLGVINILESPAFNFEFQHFILKFNKNFITM